MLHRNTARGRSGARRARSDLAQEELCHVKIPADHPLRLELNHEVHARPPEALTPPLRLTFLALYSDAAQRDREYQHVCSLARRFDATVPPPGATHYSADLGPFRIKWERHTEFTRYKFIVDGPCSDPFGQPATEVVPAEWLAEIPGEVMVASHAALLRAGSDAPDYEVVAAQLFAGNVLVGASIAGGAGIALTDCRIHDGFGRLLVFDRGMTPRQAGRMMQRLLEIDTYRLMALLALPVARSLAPALTMSEHELAQITSTLADASESDEPALLDRLTRLEAQIESIESRHHYRFAAAEAYYELVQRRIEELRETRIQGIQNFQEFTERRLAPAMNTCKAVSSRLDSLSQRIARATQLLSTRVDVSRERQNQSVLESMNRRAEAQLRLQQTVEGLSIAAITYYIVGLVGYAAKGLRGAGLDVNPDLAMGISIPVVVVIVALGMRKIRKVVLHSRR
jgi:uncharacterized membrane-anchored protein